MNTDLPSFLLESARLPFEWGVRDCCLWPCEWVASVRGIDPARRLRGSYATRSEAYRAILRAGGLEALARKLAQEVGLEETTDFLPGDIALVKIDDKQKSLAIKTKIAWAGKTPNGIVIAPFEPIVGWRV